MSCELNSVPAGAALRLVQYVDCGAEALGRDGFLRHADYVLQSGIYGAALTIFLAVFAIRFLLGSRVEIATLPIMFLKLGIVAALLTSWPAFQTLFYELAAEGPGEVTTAILASNDAESGNLNTRIQQLYEAMRLGTDLNTPTNFGPLPQAADESAGYQVQAPMPQIATLLVVGTIGFEGAAKFSAAFLLSIAPLPIIALLFFSSGLGFFVSWLRALAMTAFATIGIKLVTAFHIIALEQEFSLLALAASNTAQVSFDRQGLATVVIAFTLFSIGIVLTSVILTRGISRLIPWSSVRATGINQQLGPLPAEGTPVRPLVTVENTASSRSINAPRDRVEVMTEALERSVFREHRQTSTENRETTSGRHAAVAPVKREGSEAAGGRSKQFNTRAVLGRQSSKTKPGNA